MALARLNQELAAEDHRAIIGLCGGAVMTLVHAAHIATEDAEAWMDDGAVLDAAADRVRHALDLRSGWLDDAVRAVLPPASGTLHQWQEWSHLTVMVAQPQVMLVMKLHAARLKDLGDIRFLMDLLHLDGPAKAYDLYRLYYAKPIDLEKKLLLDGWLTGHRPCT